MYDIRATIQTNWRDLRDYQKTGVLMVLVGVLHFMLAAYFLLGLPGVIAISGLCWLYLGSVLAA